MLQTHIFLALVLGSAISHRKIILETKIWALSVANWVSLLLDLRWSFNEWNLLEDCFLFSKSCSNLSFEYGPATFKASSSTVSQRIPIPFNISLAKASAKLLFSPFRVLGPGKKTQPRSAVLPSTISHLSTARNRGRALYFIFNFSILVTLCGLQDLSSPTRGLNLSYHSASAKS